LLNVTALVSSVQAMMIQSVDQARTIITVAESEKLPIRNSTSSCLWI